jgi:hypothetical protein
VPLVIPGFLITGPSVLVILLGIEAQVSLADCILDGFCFFSAKLALDRLSQGRSGRVTTETNEFSFAVSQFFLFRLQFFCASNRPSAKRKLLD